MRKSRKHQKNKEADQLELFTMEAQNPESLQTDGISRYNYRGDELLSELKRQRALTNTILEEILDNGNLKRSYRQVKRNGGISGIDGIGVEEFGEWLGSNINQLRQTLLEETYKVIPVKRVEIPKPKGGTRTLGIPTVKDRFIQQATSQVLTRYYDPTFSEHSYGFRPKRSAHQAIVQSAKYIKEGKEWVVEIDLEKFFDKINHDRLLQRLSKGIGDKRLLRLIKQYLKAGMMNNGMEEQRISGTPQGSPLSPLLSNIVLDELDKELERRGHSFCRYADDCNVYVGSKKAGERVLESLIYFIEKKLKLKVNRQKSGVYHCTEVNFLGYTLLPEGKIRVSDNSMNRLKEKVRQITRRNRGVTFARVITELNRVLIGWTEYFKLADSWLTSFRDIDGWIRRKLRCYRLKQCGRVYTTVKFLWSLGVAKQKAWNAVYYSQGWWAMSKKVAVGEGMNNQWFARQGLVSLRVRMS